ncbi:MULTISPECIES: hypothetical protein [unclassified Streptomyces]|uniref:hypothetical protein n=1 Tax=unclassified Streptomyces TaxID=2593676 RepID=UPI00131A0AA5|nr:MULTISPECIES: hypothetical protein [unclassified Streptomyces]MYT30804.1 hypothetical protein [Streptomyces sp. SID8354]
MSELHERIAARALAGIVFQSGGCSHKCRGEHPVEVGRLRGRRRMLQEATDLRLPLRGLVLQFHEPKGQR